VEIREADLQWVGKVTFVFPFKAQWNQEVAIFLAERWKGEPGESDEMQSTWFKPAEIPYNLLWQDALHWLPRVIDGNKIAATITFQEDNETVDNVILNPLGTAVF